MDSAVPTVASPEISAFLRESETFLDNIQPPLTRASLSSILFGSGAQLDRLYDGKDITTARLNQARERLQNLVDTGDRIRPGQTRKRTPKSPTASREARDA